jgi:glycosyltransferase involved in cell wall biosynthesis
MRVLVVTDAWHPQVNGVVHSLTEMAKAAHELGAHIEFLTPDGFLTLPLPTYPDIRIAFASRSAVAKRMQAAAASHVHIATEGPLGLAARRFCLRNARSFTTSYHTRFPEYISARVPIPLSVTYAWMRRFHNAGIGTMVATESVASDLSKRGFERLMRWSRGVDAERFRPRPTSVLDMPRPIFLYVGRLAVEKNIAAFLALDLPGSKVVVGEGPATKALKAAYPNAHFLGLKTDEVLAEIYASADVFVFPSRTDTFGIVLLEALASGLPVAAYPVAGPVDVIGRNGPGILDEDLLSACLRALEIPRAAARDFALRHTWQTSARQFLANVEDARTLSMEPAPIVLPITAEPRSLRKD